MKVKNVLASDVSGFLSSPEKSRRVQVPMRLPKLAFDQKIMRVKIAVASV